MADQLHVRTVDAQLAARTTRASAAPRAPARRRRAGRPRRSAPAAAGRCRRSGRPRPSTSRASRWRAAARRAARRGRAGRRSRRRRPAAGSARARPSAAKAIVRGQRCAASAGSISRSRIRLGSQQRGHRLGRHHLAERPRGAPEVVAAVRLVEPAAVVGHEVAHAAALGAPRVAQEAEAARQHAMVGSPCRCVRPSPSATIARRATSSVQ